MGRIAEVTKHLTFDRGENESRKLDVACRVFIHRGVLGLNNLLSMTFRASKREMVVEEVAHVWLDIKVTPKGMMLPQTGDELAEEGMFYTEFGFDLEGCVDGHTGAEIWPRVFDVLRVYDIWSALNQAKLYYELWDKHIFAKKEILVETSHDFIEDEVTAVLECFLSLPTLDDHMLVHVHYGEDGCIKTKKGYHGSEEESFREMMQQMLKQSHNHRHHPPEE